MPVMRKTTTKSSDMKKQIIVIHGGDSFSTYENFLSFLKSYNIENLEKYRSENVGWKRNLKNGLGEKYEVVLPDMPNKFNAKYNEWKIWFEKLIPHFNNKVILVGHSMGGVFLVKYLAENKFPKKIIAILLVAAPYDIDEDHPIVEFTLPSSLDQFENQTNKVFLYHSKDDPVVNFTEFEKYKKNLKNAVSRIFTDRGHFNQESFPEIVEDIKSL